MTEYWCRFLDRVGNAFGAEKMDAADDADAIAKTRKIVAAGITSSYEIWHEKRLVLREHREVEAPPDVSPSGAVKVVSSGP